MTQDEFKSLEEKYGLTIEFIRHEAHELHQSVNQIYGDNLPYGFHLDMVVEMISKYGHLVCACENDLLPLFFGGFFHDSIEDARLSYNDVMKRAKKILTDDQALMATEIVYALTNDKGRTRSERAGGGVSSSSPCTQVSSRHSYQKVFQGHLCGHRNTAPLEYSVGGLRHS